MYEFRGTVNGVFNKLPKPFKVAQSALFSRQRAKNLASNSPGQVDFAIRLVNSVLNLPDGPVKYFEEFNLQKNSEINSAHQ